MDLAELSNCIDTHIARDPERQGVPQDHEAFSVLVRCMWSLMQPDGCPWDQKQTHASIAPNMLEEAYEAVEAIERVDKFKTLKREPSCLDSANNASAKEDATVHDLIGELGDVLMQVVLHAEIARRDAEFTIDDVCLALTNKLVSRHPHVFGERAQERGDSALLTARDVLDVWDAAKKRERSDASGLLDSVPVSLPALMQATKLSRRAARVGFDWEDEQGVWDKVEEEKAEFLESAPGTDHAEEEFGDLLFALTNVARKRGIDPERALRISCRKFRERFACVEKLAKCDLSELTAQELDELWERAKLNS